ncbi:MAG: beta-lactamase family protein [Betaproteobacteria bacterium]|nr:MAG: beta-lactamase family protein [Betaproteobacteria bacterium]
MRHGALSKLRLAHMHDVMAGHVERGGMPGLVMLVSRRADVHVDAIGMKAQGRHDPMRRDTIMRISSLTKPVTAAAAMILVEECRLRLDEPVDALLPELANRKVLRRLDAPLADTVSATRPITLRDLLTFRMGIGVVMAPPDTYPIQHTMDELRLGQGMPSPATPPAPDEWIRRLGTLPLMHQPGEQWSYGTGSDVLGVLIARACGQPFELFLRERLFGPLGMKDTGFSVPAAKLDRLATSYTTDATSGALERYDAPDGGQWSRPPAFPSGGAGLVSTIDDYFAFARMLLSKGQVGRERILSRPSVELMTSDHLTAQQKAASVFAPGFFDNHGWGFGVSMITRRDDVAGSIGTYGWDGGLGTAWRTDPREEMITILMTQAAWTSPTPPKVCLDFWTSAYQAIDD